MRVASSSLIVLSQCCHASLGSRITSTAALLAGSEESSCPSALRFFSTTASISRVGNRPIVGLTSGAQAFTRSTRCLGRKVNAVNLFAIRLRYRLAPDVAVCVGQLCKRPRGLYSELRLAGGIRRRSRLRQWQGLEAGEGRQRRSSESPIADGQNLRTGYMYARIQVARSERERSCVRQSRGLSPDPGRQLKGQESDRLAVRCPKRLVRSI